MLFFIQYSKLLIILKMEKIYARRVKYFLVAMLDMCVVKNINKQTRNFFCVQSMPTEAMPDDDAPKFYRLDRYI